MTRLVKVELKRLYARRLTIIGIAGVLLITGLMLFATWRSARPLTESELQQAQSQFDQVHRDWVQNADEWKKQCERDFASMPDPKPPIAEACAYPEPKLEDFGRPRFTFADTMPELLHGSAYLLAGAAFLIGASFVGAEYSSGSLGNWLTFEPRRPRVYGSKLLGALLGHVPLAVVSLTLLIGGTALIVELVGNTSTTSGKVWGDLLTMAGRSVVLAVVVAVLGSVIAMLLRHTAAAIGVLMGYLVLVEGVFGGFLTKAQPWLVRLNVDAWIKHGTTYWVDSCQTMQDGMYNCTSLEKTVSFGHSVWYLGIAVTVIVALGALVFSRRDVT